MSILLYFTGGQLSEWEGDILVVITPASPYGYDFPPYQGSIGLSLQPASLYEMEFGFPGDVELSLKPESQSAVEHAETGNVLITFHTLRTTHYADYVYQGNIDLSLSPTSPYVHDFPPVIGAIIVEVNPASIYALDSVYAGAVMMTLIPASGHFADFPYQANVILAVIPASSHFADYPYQGSILMAVMPASLYTQDFDYPCNALFALSPASSSLQDFSYLGDVLFVLLPQATIVVAGGEDFLILDAILLRTLLSEAKISKTMGISVYGLVQGLAFESYMSKTLNYRSCLKKEQIDRTLH